ncbi:hypothetical protein CLOM_g21013 [Closterium sp. NIES-68]|nr:hypothetical protein CLOM_g21013 [Closterium sp. NIES-68]GJP61628.1 hypothetical protein CLOP_g18770 [Closterium sp. NIES-67]
MSGSHPHRLTNVGSHDVKYDVWLPNLMLGVRSLGSLSFHAGGATQLFFCILCHLHSHCHVFLNQLIDARMSSVPQPSVQQVDVHWCHRCCLGRSLLLEFFDGRLL